MSGARNGALLAVADLRFERASTLCQILALASVLAPLLLLYGLKAGVVDSLMTKLTTDPQVRQITPARSGNFLEDQLRTLAENPHVGFIAPHTFRINTELGFSRAGDRSAPLFEGVMIASGPGDPLLSAGISPPEPGSLILSAQLAGAIGVGAGQQIRVIVTRADQSSSEPVEMTVSGVLNPLAWQVAGALLHWEDYADFDAFSRNHGVTSRKWKGEVPPEKYYFPGFRLFATDLDSVAPLAGILAELGYATRTQGTVIEGTLAFVRSLSTIFWIIASVAVIGYTASFGANLWSNVQRKQHELSLLRLIGLSRLGTLTFPVTQALAVGAIGWCIASALSLIAATAANYWLDGALLIDGQVCRLSLQHFVFAAVGVILISGCASGLAAHKAQQVDPADGIRME